MKYRISNTVNRVKRPILSQITQIPADKRQVGQMDLLKQIP